MGRERERKDGKVDKGGSHRSWKYIYLIESQLLTWPYVWFESSLYEGDTPL